jgi:SdpI/YfhL protein family
MSTPISLLVPCGIIAAVSVPLILKLVPPNGLYGFRTRQTLANPDIWYRANRFAGCALFIASAVSAAVFALQPQYATGRDLAGVVALLLPLAGAVALSLAYVRRIGRDAGG